MQANAAISALIGTRFRWGIVPQNPALPIVVAFQEEGQPAVTLQETGGYTRALVRLSCIAASYGGAKALADTVTAQLHGFSGTMGGTSVQGAFQEDADDAYETETGEYRVDLPFAVHYIAS